MIACTVPLQWDFILLSHCVLMPSFRRVQVVESLHIRRWILEILESELIDVTCEKPSTELLWQQPPLDDRLADFLGVLTL